MDSEQIRQTTSSRQSRPEPARSPSRTHSPDTCRPQPHRLGCLPDGQPAERTSERDQTPTRRRRFALFAPPAAPEVCRGRPQHRVRPGLHRLDPTERPRPTGPEHRSELLRRPVRPRPAPARPRCLPPLGGRPARRGLRDPHPPSHRPRGHCDLGRLRLHRPHAPPERLAGHRRHRLVPGRAPAQDPPPPASPSSSSSPCTWRAPPRGRPSPTRSPPSPTPTPTRTSPP